MIISPSLRAAAGSRPPEFTYRGAAGDTTQGLTSYTFSSQSIGPASSDRLVIVAIMSNFNAARVLNSCTIGGVTANLAVNASTNTSESTIAAIAYLNVTSGTTATIVANFNGGVNGCGIGVYTVTGLRSFTPVDTTSFQASTGRGTTSTINMAQSGCVVMSTSWRADNASSYVPTFTGMSTTNGDNNQPLQTRLLVSASNSKVQGNSAYPIGAVMPSSTSSDYWTWAAATWR